jgi:hypothetical protein
MITVRRDAVRTQGRAPKGGGDQRDREAVGSSSRLEARFLLPRCSTVPAASFNEGFYQVALICVFEARL